VGVGVVVVVDSEVDDDVDQIVPSLTFRFDDRLQ
jgi:hypothetical protein